MEFSYLLKALGVVAPFLAAWAALKGRGHEQKKFEIERKNALVEKCLPFLSDGEPTKKQKVELEAAFHSYTGIEVRHELITPIMSNPKRFELSRRLKRTQEQFDVDEESGTVKRVSGSQFMDSIKSTGAVLIYISFSLLFWYELTFELPDAISLAKQGQSYAGEMLDIAGSIVFFLTSLALLGSTGRTVISILKLEKIYDPNSIEKHPLVKLNRTLKRANSKALNLLRYIISPLTQWL